MQYKPSAPRALLRAAVLPILLLPATARAIDFQFLYADPDGTGFFDPTNGDQRRAAMQAAGDEIGRLIAPTYFGETVNVRVASSPDPNSTLLAAAKPVSFYSAFSTSDPRYQPDTFYPKALADQLHGGDVDPGHDAISMIVNTFYPFYFGTDGKRDPSQYDFVSTAAHELLHGLGFYDTFQPQGGYGTNADGTYNSQTDLSGFPTIFDRFMYVGPSGPSPLVSLSSPSRAAAITSNNVFFIGPNALAGDGGNAPQLFAPNPFKPASTGSHTDPAALPNDLMNPGTDGSSRTASSVDRGILRDLGWNIAVSSTDHTWNGSASPDNRASVSANWTGPLPLPGDSLTFQSNPSSAYSVQMDLNLYSLDHITFTPTAPAYTLHFSSYTSTDFTGAGIINNANTPHTFILESHADNGLNDSSGTAATLSFHGTAFAGNTLFQLHAGFTAQHTNPNAPPTYDRYNGAAIDFYDSSTATIATFTVQGAAGDGAPSTYARVNFHNSSTAGTATFTNQPGRTGYSVIYPSVAGFGGQTNFLDSSDALVATFNNLGQDAIGTLPSGTAGLTNFRDTSNADNATLNNLPATVSGGRGGATQFFNHASASSASFTNQYSSFSSGPGVTLFSDDTTAANATFNNLGGPTSFGGTTSFYLRSSADHATLNNRGLSGGGYGGLPGATVFHDDSTAGSANILNFTASDTGGRTEFRDRSSAANAHIILEPGNSGGTIAFYDNSTASSAHLDAGASGATGIIIFNGQSSAAHALIDLNDNGGSNLFLQFFDASTAANATINAGNSSNVQFYGTSTAASANITMSPNSNLFLAGGVYGAVSAGAANIHLLGSATPFGGSANFGYNASAANAQITVDGAPVAGGYGGQIAFASGSDAGNSTILLKASPVPNNLGGTLIFSGATGASARVITQTGSLISLSNYSGEPTLGSIDGAGSINLNSATLTTGNLGLTTTISGPISGYAGALTKTGTGQLTLTAANTYPGLTTVAQGALAINGSTPGPVQVNSGATLKGSGTIGGAVTVLPGGHLSPGNSPGTLTLASLVLADSSYLDFDIGPTSDFLNITGNLTLDGILNISSPAGFSLSNFSQDLLHYTGTLTDNSLRLGTLPAGYSPSQFAFLAAGGSLKLASAKPGDANLNLKIDPDDYALLDRGYLQHLHGRQNGDFNLDGSIDQNDFLIIDTALVQQSGSLSPSLLSQRESQFGESYVQQLLTSIPEPTSAIACLFATIPLLRRRRTFVAPLTRFFI